MDEALQIAITVTQAEIQERRNEAFYVDEARGSGTVDRPTRGTRPDGVRNATQRAGASRTQGQNRKGLREVGERGRPETLRVRGSRVLCPRMPKPLEPQQTF
jgi:hypothetical protein